MGSRKGGFSLSVRLALLLSLGLFGVFSGPAGAA